MWEVEKNLIEMTTHQPMLPSGDDEVDLREVFAALQRRWCCVLGGGLLGLVLAVGTSYQKFLSSQVRVQSKSSLVLDVAQSPCF